MQLATYIRNQKGTPKRDSTPSNISHQTEDVPGYKAVTSVFTTDPPPLSLSLRLACKISRNAKVAKTLLSPFRAPFCFISSQVDNVIAWQRASHDHEAYSRLDSTLPFSC